MQNWNSVRPMIEEILGQYKYTQRKHDEYCFLTAYQIAALLDKKDPAIKGCLSVGGDGDGASLAQQLSRQLATDINRERDACCVELAFFSIAGLDSITFADNQTPSNCEFSMFRLRPKK